MNNFFISNLLQKEIISAKNLATNEELLPTKTKHDDEDEEIKNTELNKEKGEAHPEYINLKGKREEDEKATETPASRIKRVFVNFIIIINFC